MACLCAQFLHTTDATVSSIPFQVPVDADDAEIEERILQHLAAAAAIHRSHRHARREGRRSRSATHGHGHGHPQVMFFQLLRPPLVVLCLHIHRKKGTMNMLLL